MGGHLANAGNAANAVRYRKTGGLISFVNVVSNQADLQGKSVNAAVSPMVIEGLVFGHSGQLVW